MPVTMEQLRTKHGADAAKMLRGKTVRAVSYMTDEERDAAGFDSSPLVVEFDDDTVLFAQRDPEGNGPGTLVVSPVKGQPKIFGDI